MAQPQIKLVTVIGVGLLGGSVAMAAKRVFGAKVIGVGRRQASLDAALAAGAIDEAHLAGKGDFLLSPPLHAPCLPCAEGPALAGKHNIRGGRKLNVPFSSRSGENGDTQLFPGENEVAAAFGSPGRHPASRHAREGKAECPLFRALGDSDLVILATPVGVFEDYLRAIAPALKKGAAVTDVGSTKALVVRSAEAILGRGGPFVGSHPMAGSEAKGVQFARADLLAGATCVVTPTKNTPPRLARFIESFWRALGMKVVRMTPAAHDKSVAAVSHLPHALASLLMLLPRDADLKVAATGFRDMTRLAAGDVEMWRDILLTNRQAILNAIDGFDESLVHLRDVIATGDGRGIENFLKAAKRRRDSIFTPENGRSR